MLVNKLGQVAVRALVVEALRKSSGVVTKQSFEALIESDGDRRRRGVGRNT